MKKLQKTKNLHKKKLNVVSLFSGAGGLDFAACKTGFVNKLFSSDSNEIFLQTTINNLAEYFPDVKHQHLLVDVKELNGDTISRTLGSTDIDLLIGGPPCDDFTPAGKKRGMLGNKAPLIFHFARIVSEIKPSAFLFENVPNLQKMCGTAFNRLLKMFEDAGYFIQSKILESRSYGVPSIRKRLFVVGYRSQELAGKFCFPHPTHGENEREAKQLKLFKIADNLHNYVTVKDVLQDLPDVTESKAALYRNHCARNHRPATIEHLKTIPQGVAVSKSYRYRAPWEGLSRSLTAGLDNSAKAYIHPCRHREMTVREYARIHGFPDDWEFAGRLDSGLKQVANAVPIPLGSAVMTALCSILVMDEGAN